MGTNFLIQWKLVEMPACAPGCTFKSKQFCDRSFPIGGAYNAVVSTSRSNNASI